ncbi:alpha/beta hydrolase [Staphylococcus caeli]|uniref:alpha/beta hydrolase n=1 Tax=Staphylococcus caeli TaxID=2201815 RepID=UPI003F578BF9
MNVKIRTLTLTFQQQEINVKLPKSYYKTEGKSYPLIIVQDGDYLYGNIEEDVIFVGIVPNDRKRDYIPWKAEIDGIEYGGEADHYLNWVADALIPYLRKCFSVSNNIDDIGIGGASFGGLVSLYALFYRPDAFGKYILISPSVWYPEFTDFMKAQLPIHETKQIYWYVGELEGQQSKHLNQYMLPCTEYGVDIINELLVSEQSRFYFVTNKKGLHRKPFFQKYFKKAVKKMF